MTKRVKIQDRIGEVFSSTKSGRFTIIQYKGSGKFLVKFIETGYQKLVAIKEILNGKIKDPYYPSIYGVAYTGEGVYPISYYRNGKKANTPAYEVWIGKLKNCYGTSKSNHLYDDVQFCKEWLCFQNFAKWFYEQVNIYGKGGSVDKDLLFLGNREYSPYTCAYVPPAVNSLFSGTSGNINGVHWCNNKKKWIAQLHCGEITKQGRNKQTYLGKFDCKESANSAYYAAKVTHVKSVALKYQDQIPPALFYKLYTGAENYVNYYTPNKEE